MNIGTIQIPAFLTALLAAAVLVIVPMTAMAMSRLPNGISAGKADPGDGAACDLPPTVQLEGRSDKDPAFKEPSLDSKVTENTQTATFAMG